MILTKEQFKIEFDQIKKQIKDDVVDLKYAWSEYNEKVAPYLPLIASWKADKGLTLVDIRLLLGVGSNVWRIITKLSEFENFGKVGGSFIEAKMEKDFLEAKQENQGNAKFHEMGFKLYHTRYKDRKDINYNVPQNISLEVKDARAKKIDTEDDD